MNIFFTNLLAVFLLSLIELWLAIPMGFVLKMNPFLIAGIVILGSIWSVLLVVVIGDKAVSLLMKLRGEKIIKTSSRTYQFWTKYGIPGLGLISPLVLGAPLGTAIGVALGSDIGKLVCWMSIGIILWTIAITAALWIGVIGINTFL